MNFNRLTRMTERLYGGETVSVNGKVYYDEVADIVERLAEFEDKVENGELIEKAELEKALAEKQDKGQDLTVKTIFKYNREIKEREKAVADKDNKGIRRLFRKNARTMEIKRSPRRNVL